MAKRLAFLLCFSLSLSTLLPPLSNAEIRRYSTPNRAQNGGGGRAVELWCVAKNNAEDAALQSALDWACGPGGADCSPIQQGGPCYDPSDIQTTASYAFNDYFLKHGLSQDSCNFDNTAALTSLNPSHDKCKFSSSLTVKNGNSSGLIPSVGLGPSENISGSNQLGLGSFWYLILGHFLLIVSCIILG